MRSERDGRNRRGKVASDTWAKEERGQQLAYHAPTGIPAWKGTKDKTHMISVVPYTVGKGNPYAKPGELYWQRTYFVHSRIGPNSAAVICSAKMFSKPCAVCDYKNKMYPDPFKDEATKKASGKLMPQERQIVLFFDHDEKEKGVQLFDVAFKNFGEAIRDKIRMARPNEREKLGQFFDPDNGMYVMIGVKEKVTPDYKFLEFKNIEFKERKNPLSDKILDAAICLDDLIKMPKYDEVKELIDPQREEEDEQNNESEEEDDGNTEEEREEDEEEDSDLDEADEDGGDDEDPPEVGDDVSALINGVRKSGTVLKIKGEKAKVKLVNGKIVILDLDDLRKFEQDEDDDEEEEDSDLDDEEEEEEKEPPLVKKPKPKPKAEKEDRSPPVRKPKKPKWDDDEEISF